MSRKIIYTAGPITTKSMNQRWEYFMNARRLAQEIWAAGHAALCPHLNTLMMDDPCIPEYADPPPPCDLVYCGDVLEHVEPDCLNAVLNDLRRLTLKAVLLVICTGPAAKTLQDGRNAHLIQEGPRWWLDALDERWEIDSLFFDGRDLSVAGRPG